MILIVRLLILFEKCKVSVAMATYNGEKFIKEQLESILCNLRKNDEIVISDDGSKDSTREIAESLNDSRIRIIDGPCKGVIKNFENAIVHCEGDIIFLSDQDDIWDKNKLVSVLKCFERHPECTCVVHDARVVDDKMNVIIDSFFHYRHSRAGLLNNLYRNSYMGCCMSFKRCIVGKFLPIPEKVSMHDQWIGMVSDKVGKSVFLDKVLLYYRRHANTVTDFGHTTVPNMIKNRIYYIGQLMKVKK